MAVTTGNGVISDRLQRLYCGKLGVFNSHFKACDLSIRRYLKGITEDGGITQLFHQRACKLCKGIADNDHLGNLTKLIQKFFCSRHGIDLCNGFLNFL